MNRANQFVMNLLIWFVLAGMLCIYAGLVPFAQDNHHASRYRVWLAKWNGLLAMQKMRQRHLYEQVFVRYIGLRSGILSRETTLVLAQKTVAYVCVRTLNLFLQ